MKIINRKISEINPAKYNPRQISDSELSGLKESLKKFGFVEPLIVNSRTGTLVGGHQRLKAAESLGFTEVPIVEVDLSLSEEKALNVALNSHTISGKYDEAILKDLLSEIKIDMPDLFDGLNMGDLLPEIAVEVLPSEGLTDPDTVPELPAEPTTKRGDVWILGNHRLMCGDSTMIDDVEKLMNGEKADMVFTDPPYGVSYQSNMRTKSDKFAVLENDDKILTEWISHLDIVSKGFVFIWTTWKVLQEWFDATSVMGKPSNLIVWDKGGGGIGDLEKTFSTDHEMALVFHRGTKITGKRIGSVWSIGKDASSKYLHPTQKPVELAEMAIVNTTDERQLVLDFFTGSGSTLIACEKTGRRARLMELDPKYCDVIIKRWEDFTGKKAILENL